ncbi:MAG: chemotaxis protein CheW [Terriglobia bacterium]
MSDNDEIIKEFLIESTENLDQLDRDLVELEKDPSSHEILSNIFRTIHTIKGATGFLGFPKLESVAHSGESLLGRLRDGKLSLTPEITSGLLAMVDSVREMLKSIESGGTDGERDYGSLIEVLNRLQAIMNAPLPGAEIRSPENAEPAENLEAPEAPIPFGQILVRSGQVSEEELASALEAQKAGDPRRLGEILVERGAIPPSAVKNAIEEQKQAQVSVAGNTIRVDVGQLDKLMNLVGELVLARNQIMQFCATQQDAGIIGASQRLNLVTAELQEGVMKTRMQPIDTVWSKLPRIVRDLAVNCGKQVRVEMEGKETELDKTVIEAIKDPLTHVVRNSIDHGIEAPERRVAAGKPAEGCLSLRAFHEGGQVIIQISDDGAGINLDRVKKKAIERGLVTPEQAASMKEREALNLIFLPGFSTAAKVTNVSGRGVGMDVVRTNIEKIGGTVDVQSKAGHGTTLKIKIPLTLAIIPALIVTSAGERYAIPQINLLELVRLEGDEARTGIESAHGAPVYRLRGNLLSLVYLNRELKLPAAAQDGAAVQDVVNIVLLQADDRQFGLVVDEINDTEEIVVKPLGQQLKGLTVYAGATIMGDGRVALILDVLGIAQRASIVGEARDRKRVEEEKAKEQGSERRTLLLFESPDDGRMVIPLSEVTRLEEFSRSAIERSGNQQVVQYRGGILPLLRLSGIVEERRRRRRVPPSKQARDGGDKVHVVVHTRNGRSVGLLVDRILDIVEDDLSTRRPSSRKGILGSVVIQGKVMEMLDLSVLIRAQDPSFFVEPSTLKVGV